MNNYVTGSIIRKLREERGLTQLQLAEKLIVSEKTVSKWETGRGYPDISLLEPLAAALGISVIELMAGQDVTNRNRSFKMSRMKFHVCPVCGNVIFATGEAVISCCGIVLPPLTAEEPDPEHTPNVEISEDEYYVTLDHEMTRAHSISFMAAVRDDGCEIKKLYPESQAEARFKISRTQFLYWYCSKHGLYRMAVKRPAAVRGGGHRG